MGAKAGPEIPYQWSPPSRLPQFLPALALLLLLLPKRNRAVQVLWVGAPVTLGLAVASLLWGIPAIRSDAPQVLFEILTAAAFGLAAVWLLSPYLKGRVRFLTFLGMLATMEFFGLLSFLVGLQWGRDSGPAEMFIGVAMFALVFSLVLNLAGWSCRGRFGRRRLSLWLILWIMAAWLAVFAVMSLIERPGPLLEMATGFVIMSAVSFGLLLPFLVLSFANDFYRERLKELLRLANAAPNAAP